MTSPADRERQNLDDIERIARAFWATHSAAEQPYPFDELPAEARADLCGCIRKMLDSDVIRVGSRPHPRQQLEGQMALDGLAGSDR